MEPSSDQVPGGCWNDSNPAAGVGRGAVFAGWNSHGTPMASPTITPRSPPMRRRRSFGWLSLTDQHPLTVTHELRLAAEALKLWVVASHDAAAERDEAHL